MQSISIKLTLLLQISLILTINKIALGADERLSNNEIVGPLSEAMKGEQDSAIGRHQETPSSVDSSNQIGSSSLEARNDRSFIRDIVERLHALDADIGKLLYNSTSMYTPDDKVEVIRENQPKGNERFTEVLADLDSLQDEVSDFYFSSKMQSSIKINN